MIFLQKFPDLKFSKGADYESSPQYLEKAMQGNNNMAARNKVLTTMASLKKGKADMADGIAKLKSAEKKLMVVSIVNALAIVALLVATVMTFYR